MVGRYIDPWEKYLQENDKVLKRIDCMIKSVKKV